MGHTEGITYVSAKGDGRYVISNGKDQKLRLWDLRKMRSNHDLEAVEDDFYGTNFDYRFVPAFVLNTGCVQPSRSTGIHLTRSQDIRPIQKIAVS